MSAPTLSDFEMAMEDSPLAASPRRKKSGTSKSPGKRSSSRARQKLVAFMLKNLEMSLEDLVSDSESSDDDDASPRRAVRSSLRNDDAQSTIPDLPEKKKKVKKEKKAKKDKGNKDEKKKKKKKKENTEEDIDCDILSASNVVSVETPSGGAIVSDEEEETEHDDPEPDEKSMGKLLQKKSSIERLPSGFFSQDETMASKVSCEGSNNSGSDKLSIAEIKKYVMENISDEVRDKIPEEAWGQLFKEAERAEDEERSTPTTRSPSNSFNQTMNPYLSRRGPPEELSHSDGVTLDIEMDNSSAVSEITTHTAAVRREDSLREREPSLRTRESGQRSLPIEDSFSVSSPVKKRGTGYPTAFVPPRPVHMLAPLVEAPTRPTDLHVRFSTVSVRYFKRILDLNPSVTSGPAIGIGWSFRTGMPMSVDQWEFDRAALRGPAELVIPRHEREDMLLQLGYTQQEIAQAVRTIRKCKNMRRTTVENLNAQMMEEKMENAANMMKSLLRIGKRHGIVR